LSVSCENCIEDGELILNLNLPRDADIDVEIYNIVGQKARSISRKGVFGMNRIKVDMNLAKGLYFYRIEARYSDGRKESVLGRCIGNEQGRRGV
jgi:hypothetical protein